MSHNRTDAILIILLLYAMYLQVLYPWAKKQMEGMEGVAQNTNISLFVCDESVHILQKGHLIKMGFANTIATNNFIQGASPKRSPCFCAKKGHS